MLDIPGLIIETPFIELVFIVIMSGIGNCSGVISRWIRQQTIMRFLISKSASSTKDKAKKVVFKLSLVRLLSINAQ